MTVEFVGYVRANPESEPHPSRGGPVIDPEYLVRLARAHEDAGFDKALIGWTSAAPDGLQIAAHAAARTDRLAYLIAHRPGFVFPTVAARMFATLDHVSGGRVALHTISGASDAEQRRDGDHAPKADRYRRSGEFLRIVKQAWTSPTAFDFDGEFYSLEDYLCPVKPVQRPHIPIYFAGSSVEAFEVGAAEADVFMFYALPLDQLAGEFDKLRAAAARLGRPVPRIGVSMRAILGDTEAAAWERAYRVLERTTAPAAARADSVRAQRTLTDGMSSVSARLKLEAAERGERHDNGALWTGMAAASRGAGNSTVLVGTPEVVAEALLAYAGLGATSFLLNGYDGYDDVVDFGRELMPRVRAGVAAAA